jgi:hypothetical protein
LGRAAGLLKSVLLRTEPRVVNAAALSVLAGLAAGRPPGFDGSNDVCIVGRLRESELFAEFETAELAFLAEKGERRRAPAGEVLFDEGGVPDAAWVVLEGEVELEGEGSAFEGRRRQGAVVGEADLFLGRRKHRAASLGADLVRLSTEHLAECAKRFPRAGLRLVARRQDVMGAFE